MSKGDPIFIYFYFFHFFFSNWGVLKFFFCWEDKDDFLDFILFFSFNVSFIPLSSFPCSLLSSCVRFHLIFILLWLATISFWLLRKIRIFSKNNKQKENLDKFFLFFKQQQKNQNKKSLLPILDFGGAALSGPEGFCGPVFSFLCCQVTWSLWHFFVFYERPNRMFLFPHPQREPVSTGTKWDSSILLECPITRRSR